MSRSPTLPHRPRPSSVRLALALAALAAPEEDREPLVGDLLEELELREEQDPRAARRWLWRQAVCSLPHRPRMGRRRPAALSGGENAMSQLLQDLRFGVRSLLKARSFTLVTVLTLALAIGATGAIFSMLEKVLLSDLPIGEPERVAFVRMEHPERGLVRQDLSLPDFLDLREAATTFEHLAATRGASRVLSIGEESEIVQVLLGTANIFEAWGARPILGRSFAPGEDAPGAESVVILSHGSWQRRFGGDPGVLGRSLEIGGRPSTVVGVMGEEMEFADLAAIELWMPLTLTPGGDRGQRDIWVSGRLAAGRSFAEAQEELGAAFSHLQVQHPATNQGWQVAVKTAKEDVADDAFKVVMAVLSLTVLGILLVACSNVATLHIARAGERGRELAVRAALGAGRLRIVRQLMTESLLLSLAAAALGLAVTRGIQRGLVAMVGENSGATHIFRMMTIDRNVLLFSLLLAFAAPAVFGLLPALKAVRRDLRSSLHRAGRGGNRSDRGRRLLVGFQVATALALMLAVGALLRSTLEMRSVELGYDADAVWSASLDLTEDLYGEPASRTRFYGQAMERVRALPSVESAAWIGRRPFDRGRGASTLRIREVPPAREDYLPHAFTNLMGPETFDLLPMTRLAGRTFTPEDDERASPVAVINREMLRRYWGDTTAPSAAVGHHVRLGDTGEWIEIVGVVESLPQPSLTQSEWPELYLPVAQRAPEGVALLARVRGEREAATLEIRRAIRSIDGRQPIGDVRTLGQIYEDAWATAAAVEKLLGAFAFFAMVMAAAGIYGVASYVVSRRTQELGLRMALGAGSGAVGTLVLRQGARVLVGGIMVGLVLGAGLLHILASGIDGLRAVDPGVIALVTVSFLAVAALANLLPLRRAIRLDPVKALREE